MSYGKFILKQLDYSPKPLQHKNSDKQYVAAPELWNNSPEDIKSANSIDDFKRKLKHFFLSKLMNHDVFNC